MGGKDNITFRTAITLAEERKMKSESDKKEALVLPTTSQFL